MRHLLLFDRVARDEGQRFKDEFNTLNKAILKSSRSNKTLVQYIMVIHIVIKIIMRSKHLHQQSNSRQDYLPSSSTGLHVIMIVEMKRTERDDTIEI